MLCFIFIHSQNHWPVCFKWLLGCLNNFLPWSLPSLQYHRRMLKSKILHSCLFSVAARLYHLLYIFFLKSTLNNVGNRASAWRRSDSISESFCRLVFYKSSSYYTFLLDLYSSMVFWIVQILVVAHYCLRWQTLIWSL